jgi:hypothetical protein
MADVVNLTRPSIKITFDNSGNLQVHMEGQVSPPQMFLAAGVVQRLANKMLDVAEMQQQEVGNIARQIIREKH